jgi:hypothetical protein
VETQVEYLFHSKKAIFHSISKNGEILLEAQKRDQEFEQNLHLCLDLHWSMTHGH